MRTCSRSAACDRRHDGRQGGEGRAYLLTAVTWGITLHVRPLELSTPTRDLSGVSMSDQCGCGGHGHSHGTEAAPATSTATTTVAAPVIVERREDQINLSPVAASKVKSLLEQEGRDDLSLRISVQPGGCSGLRYQLFFDERSLDGDVVTDFDGVAVVVDRMSVPYLNGAVIDFVDSIEKQGFTIDNPNATGSCACGDSFH